MSDKDEWLSIRDIAQELRVPVKSVYHWRRTGAGPKGVRLGRLLRFRRSEVNAWLRGRADNGGSGEHAAA